MQQTPVSNDNLQPKKQDAQPLITNATKRHSSQKQFSRREWTIGLALFFGAIGATLVVIGIIPEIAAIGVIATAVLAGAAGAALGGAAGYLTGVTVNKFHSEGVTQGV